MSDRDRWREGQGVTFLRTQPQQRWPHAKQCARIRRLVSAKKYRSALRKLRPSLPELSELEAILFARSMAATPDQRWEMNASFLRSLGFSALSAKRKLISK